MQSSNPVLFVEDDPVHAMAVEKAFRDMGIAQPLVHTRNGEEALEYLRNQNDRVPDFILLDLHMPKMDGIEFLTVVKADPVLRRIPVVMLTTSQDPRDITECFALNAAGYMIKPLDDEQLAETIKTIVQYWSHNELPNQRGDYGQYTALNHACSGR